MREIKFRAWDKNQSFIDKTSGYSYGAMVYSVNIGLSKFFEKYHALPLMQYTGLKDKNGVKIFEGDVCKAWENVGGVYDERIVVIEWHDCGLVGALGDFAHYTPNPSWEVIGNIYENPELLK